MVDGDDENRDAGWSCNYKQSGFGVVIIDFIVSLERVPQGQNHSESNCDAARRQQICGKGSLSSLGLRDVQVSPVDIRRGRCILNLDFFQIWELLVLVRCHDHRLSKVLILERDESLSNESTY